MTEGYGQRFGKRLRVENAPAMVTRALRNADMAVTEIRCWRCRRFADTLADVCARLGVDAVRYSLIVVDLHHLLLASLPAHS